MGENRPKLVQLKKKSDQPTTRISSGIPGLDNLMERGFVNGSMNLVAGETGTGKTIFCLQFALNALRKGEKVIYLTLEERESDVLRDVEKFGWKNELENYMKGGMFIIESRLMSDISEVSKIVHEILKSFPAKYFILDSLSVATFLWKETGKDMATMRNELLSLLVTLKDLEVTSLFVSEIQEDEKKLGRYGFEQFIADSIIQLHYLEYSVGGVPRSLSIRKMRKTKHGMDIYPFEITNKGIIVRTK